MHASPEDPQAQYPYVWRKSARAGFEVEVAWRTTRDGVAASGEVRDLRGGTPPGAFALDLSGPTRTMVMLVHPATPGPETFVDVTLQLLRDGDRVQLDCNLPISNNEYFNGVIGQWPLAGPEPDPARPDDDDDDDDVAILAPADAGDLFPFVWMQPLDRRQLEQLRLRFVPCPDPASLPLYTALLAATDAAAKIAQATSFRGGDVFVPALSTLGTTVARMPAVCRELLQLRGEIPMPELTAFAAMALGLPPDTDLETFLTGDEWQDALPRIWQSVFALALAGTPADAALAGQLCATLRLGRFLALATEDAATSPSLCSEAARQLGLQARIVVPDAVATHPPAPSLSGGGGGSLWEVLGIGQLQLARHRLLGYVPGELADVVNVMPRERQEVRERTRSSAVAQEREQRSETRDRSGARTRSDSSELADAVAEVMSSDGVARDMSDVTPAYDNLNMSLSGIWGGAGAGSGWQRRDQAALARRVTERAVHRLGDRIARRRRLEWHVLRERRSSQLIDNSLHDRLVGLYHWIDRVVRVRLEPLGGRLVLQFLQTDPAADWLQQLRDATQPPLQAPPALPAPPASSPPYSVVTRDNYQALGAGYGVLDLEPPPPAQCSVSAVVDRVTCGDVSMLRIPDGYSAVSGNATLAIADGRYALACAIGATDLPATPASAETPLSASPPTLSGHVPGAASLTPPTPVAPVLQTSALSGIADATGPVPVTVITSAPAFAVTIQVLCALAGSADANPLYVGWQIRTYARLLEAWRDADIHDGRALAERIRLAAQAGDVQREVLRQACVGALASVPNESGHAPATYAALLDWPHMTWQYAQAAPATDPSWPEPTPSARLRADADPGSGMAAFLRAGSARVLVPATSGSEAWLLSLLQFPVPWAGGPADAPATAASVPLLEALLIPDDAVPEPAQWTLRVPTALLYLRPGTRLPLLPGASPTGACEAGDETSP